MTKKELSHDNKEALSWSEIKKNREIVKSHYRSIFDIPILYCTKKQLVYGILKNFNGSILDIGAADRFVGEIWIKMKKDGVYKSMDIDSARFHDYYTFEEINERFDMIFILDVIEHLSLRDGKILLEKCAELLNPSGKIVITIPNNLHPTAFAGDCTHVVSYRYHDLGCLVLSSGFKELEIFRVSPKRKIKHKLMAIILRPVLKFLDIDFAAGLLLIAKKA